MKRDLSLVREILLRLEPLSATPDQPAPLNVGKPPLDIPDYTDEEIVYHLRIMEDGGLISYNLGIQAPGVGYDGPSDVRFRLLGLPGAQGADDAARAQARSGNCGPRTTSR
jgi:hypothetical protein